MSEQEAQDDGGLLGAGLTKLFGRSYRTTIAGLVGLVGQGGFLIFQVTQGHMTPEQAIPLALGMITAGGLVVAKDSRVTGLPKR